MWKRARAHTLTMDFPYILHPAVKFFETKSISIFIDFGFINKGEGIDVLYSLFSQLIELFLSNIKYYSKQSIFICLKACLEGIFKF